MFDKKKYAREYCIKNREKKKEYDKKYCIENREKIKEYRKKNREKQNKQKRQWYLDNKEHVQEYNIRNQEKFRKYYGNNKEHIREKRNQRRKIRWRTDSRYKLRQKMSTSIIHSLKGNKNGRKWESLVGYSVNDLMKRLKQTLPLGYTWKDYLDCKLHIDHIIPISAFEFDQPEDFQFHECWSLKNLRLLPARENLIKRDKIIKSYQLALKL